MTDVPTQASSRVLAPESVVRRLEELRAISTVERDDEARTRLARERPERRETFAVAVERRLRELRALCDLSSYLHRARPVR